MWKLYQLRNVKLYQCKKSSMRLIGNSSEKLQHKYIFTGGNSVNRYRRTWRLLKSFRRKQLIFNSLGSLWKTSDSRYLCIKICRCSPKSGSGVASPKIWGAKMFDFRRITLFCLENRLSNHKRTIFSKILGGSWPPVAAPMNSGLLITGLFWTDTKFQKLM